MSIAIFYPHPSLERCHLALPRCTQSRQWCCSNLQVKFVNTGFLEHFRWVDCSYAKYFADTNELYRQILCNLAIKHLCTVKDCCSTCQYKKVTVGRQITRKIWWLFCYGVQFHLSPLRDSPFTHHFIRIRMSGWHRIKVVVYIYTPHTNPISSKCKGLILGEWLSFSLDFFHTNF